MEILGVGPTELLFILIIVLIVIGPKDLAKTGTTIGRWLNNLIQSPTWRAVQRTSKELRQLPTNLMREANLEKILSENKSRPAPGANTGTWQGGLKPVGTPAVITPPGKAGTENTIQPPVIIPTPAETSPQPGKTRSAPRKTATPEKKKTTRKTSKASPRKKTNA